MPAGELEEEKSHDYAGDEYRADILGYREIPRLVFLAVDNLDKLTLVVTFGGNLEGGVAIDILLTVGHTRGGEDVQTILAPDYNGKRNALVMVERHLPTVTVPEMLEDGFLYVELMLVGLLGDLVKSLLYLVLHAGRRLGGGSRRSGVLRDNILSHRGEGPACHQNQYKSNFFILEAW